MDYILQEDARARARSMAAGMRAMITPSAHEAAEQLAASLRALNGESTYAVDAAKARTVRKRVQAEREALSKLDLELWLRQQAAISDAYRADMARYVASGCSEAVKSQLAERWCAAPGTKRLMPTRKLLVELGVCDG